MHNRRVGRDIFTVEVYPLIFALPKKHSPLTIYYSGQKIRPRPLGALKVGAIGLAAIQIVIVDMIAREVIATTPVVTLLVVALLLQVIVLHAVESLLPVEMIAMAGEEEATVDPLLDAVLPIEEGATGIEAAVRRQLKGEGTETEIVIVIVIAIVMTEMTEMTEMI